MKYAWVIVALLWLTRPAFGWWEAFQHPGLSAAIEQGLAAHPDPAAAQARLQAAQAGVGVASAARLPRATIDAGFRAGREQSMNTGGVEDDIDPLFGSARLSWELDLFGKIAPGVDAARATAAMTEAEWEGTQLMLSLDIARTYIELAYQGEALSALAGTVEARSALHRRSVNRVEAGLDAPVTADATLAAWQHVEHQLMAAETTRDRLAARLRNLLGGTDPAIPAGTLNLFTLPPPPDLAAADFIPGRPDVIAAYQALQAAEGQTISARRQNRPSLSLMLQAAGEGEDAGDIERWSAWAGPVLSVPLWRPEVGRQMEAASARAEAQRARWQAVSLRAAEEIDRAWAERSRADAMIGHAEAILEARTRSAAIATRKRAAGLIQDSDRLLAALDQDTATLNHARTTADALQSHIALIGAIGR